MIFYNIHCTKCGPFYWTFKEFEDLLCGWNGNEKLSYHSINYNSSYFKLDKDIVLVENVWSTGFKLPF